MTAETRTVRLAGREIACRSHVCAFFYTEGQAYDVLLPFIRDGFAAGDRAFHIVDPARRQNHLTTLADAGIDPDARQQARQLEVRPWQEAYLRGGRFDQDAMLALIQEVLREGRSLGFPMTRLVANMEWALESQPGVHDLVAYEARLNEVLPQYEDTVICTYDLARFSAPVVMDILRTHPMVIVGDIVQSNPFYVPPDLFLAELRERALLSSSAV
jgi:hypothetical protein